MRVEQFTPQDETRTCVSDNENHETYLVRLWLMNDEHDYNHAQSLVADAGNVTDGADDIAEYVTEEADIALDSSTGMFNDLLGYALRQVDWVSIARVFKPDEWEGDDAPEEDE